jgi:NAD(P)-dependent dehydrogenase (short-subunit alcohol dehydrogenase family)
MTAGAPELDGRVAIVTGGGTGIGYAIAEELASRGARVVLASRKPAKIDDAAARINSQHPGAAIAVAAHVGHPDELERLVDLTLATYARLDILVNNAATNFYSGATADADVSVFDKTFEINLRGPFVLSSLAIRKYMAGHGGSILNIASVGGVKPRPGRGVYAITKAALIFMTRQLAVEVGPMGIRVNAIAPGLVKTDFSEPLWGDQAFLQQVLSRTAMERIGTPVDIAKVAAFIVSDQAAYMSGEVVVLDGAGY